MIDKSIDRAETAIITIALIAVVAIPASLMAAAMGVPRVADITLTLLQLALTVTFIYTTSARLRAKHPRPLVYNRTTICGLLMVLIGALGVLVCAVMSLNGSTTFDKIIRFAMPISLIICCSCEVITRDWPLKNDPLKNEADPTQ